MTSETVYRYFLDELIKISMLAPVRPPAIRTLPRTVNVAGTSQGWPMRTGVSQGIGLSRTQPLGTKINPALRLKTVPRPGSSTLVE